MESYELTDARAREIARPIEQPLVQLEAIFPEFITHVRNTHDVYKDYPGTYAKELNALRDKMRTKVEEAVGRVNGAFDTQLGVYRRTLESVQRSAEQGDDQRQYVDTVATMPLLMRLRPEQLADRLERAIELGLTGQVRGLTEVIEAIPPADNGDLYGQGRLAAALAQGKQHERQRTPGEVKADAELRYLANARNNFRLWSVQINNRISDVFETRSDYGRGNFSPKNVFGV